MSEVIHVANEAEFPSAHPGDHQRNFDVLDQERQSAWDYYLGSGKRGGDRKTQYLESSITSREIDRKLPVIAEMKMTSGGNKERDILVNEYQDYAPTSLAEARDGVIGLQRRIDIAANTANENIEADVLERAREHAVVARVRNFQGYLIEAAHDLDTLQQIMKHPADAESRFDPELFRSSEEAQQVIVKQLLFRGFLWDKYEGHWPSKNSNKYKEREKYWRGFVIEMVKNASDEPLVDFLKTFYDRAEARYKFLSVEYSNAERMPIVQSLLRRGELVPITLGKLWGDKLARERRDEPAQQAVTINQPATGSFVAPQAARDEMEEQRRKDEQRARIINSEYDHEWDVLERSMRKQPHQIRAILAARGLARALSREEQFEADEEAELAEIRERARQPKPPPKKRPKIRFRRGRETGPSDKRIETDYR